MDAPPITIVMTVFIPPTGEGFSRMKNAEQTVMSWVRNLHYAGEIRFHIADDTVEAPEQTEHLASLTPWNTGITHTKGMGLGGALNAGVAEALAVSPLWLYADDSYSLRDRLDLTVWARILTELGMGVPSGNTKIGGAPSETGGVGAIALMGPRPEQHDGNVINYEGIHTEKVQGILFSRHGYNWNGRPFLYHQRFTDYYGPFKENCSGYDWEQHYAEQYAQNSGGPAVLHALHDPWLHVWSARLGDKPPGWDGKYE